MHFILERLCDDHKQMMKVLFHLGRQVRVYCASPSDICLDQMIDIIDFIQVYPETWHHPTEDIIYDKLLEKDTPIYSLILRTVQEHNRLEELTLVINDVFNRAAAGESIDRGLLIKTANDYIHQQISHIKVEQARIFPIADQCLDREDWQHIMGKVKSVNHSASEADTPMHDYRGIFQQIANQHPATM